MVFFFSTTVRLLQNEAAKCDAHCSSWRWAIKTKEAFLAFSERNKANQIIVSWLTASLS